jgi:hypothetical protein
MNSAEVGMLVLVGLIVVTVMLFRYYRSHP